MDGGLKVGCGEGAACLLLCFLPASHRCAMPE